MPEKLLRHLLTALLKALFRVELRGVEHFAATAGRRTVIIANHQSFLDPLLLAVFLPEKPAFAMNVFQARKWYFRPLLMLVDVFTVDPMQPMSTKSIIQRLKAGQRVVVFPEGRITTTGGIMKVYEGTGLIIDRTDALVLPVRVEGAQYSRLSRMQGKLRLRWFPKISLTLHPPQRMELPEVRGRQRRALAAQRIHDMLTESSFAAAQRDVTLAEALLAASALHGMRRKIITDAARAELSYRALWTKAFALARALFPLPLRERRESGLEAVGILLPTAPAAVAAFWAVQLGGRVPAMLNFSAGTRNLLTACETAQIRTVLTSRAFVEKAKLEETAAALEGRLPRHPGLVPGSSAQERHLSIEETLSESKLHPALGPRSRHKAGMTEKEPCGGNGGEARAAISVVYLEDLRGRIRPWHKLSALWKAHRAKAYLPDAPANAPAVILFTSGSEGVPKGVVLSHANLLANIHQASARLSFTANDVMLNALPVFHSFGLMAGTLLPLMLGIRVFMYPNPLHYRVVPECAYDCGATILLGTDTFYNGYARYAHPFDFHTVRLAVAGAEKLKPATRQLYAERFGVRILEGYGVTETSPVLAVNTPLENKPGSVGRLMPGMQARLAPVEGIRQGGRLEVRGPNVMQGYMRHDAPGVTAFPFLPEEEGERWYDTGDIVEIDAQGYISIIGRAKRFAKLGGEMVSLAAVEECAAALWPQHAHAAVAAPDARKGEQIVLLTECEGATREALLRYVQEQGLPELMIPRRVTFMEALPRLGNGKVDYVALA